MSEDKFREQFEAAIVDALGLKIYKVPERDTKNAWYGFKICAKIKDAEIEELNLEIQKRDKCSFIGAMRDCPTHGESKEIEQLNAKVAMLREAIDDALGSFKCTQNAQDYPSTHWSNLATKALAATEADVTKFLNGVRAGAVAEYLRQAQATMCAKVVS